MIKQDKDTKNMKYTWENISIGVLERTILQKNQICFLTIVTSSFGR